MAIKTNDSIARANFEYERVEDCSPQNMSGSPFMKVLANHQFCIVCLSGYLTVSNNGGWSQIGTIPVGYRPMDDFRSCGLRQDFGTAELRVESNGAISVRSPQNDFIRGNIFYFRDNIGGTYTAPATNAQIKPINFAIQTASFSFVSGMDGGVGQQKIWACNHVVIIKYDRAYIGASHTGNTWTQTATIPAGFRPNGDYRAVMSRNYKTGIDARVDANGAFFLRNINQNDIVSGGMVYFR